MKPKSMLSGGIGIPDGAFKRFSKPGESAIESLVQNEINITEIVQQGGGNITFTDTFDDTQNTVGSPGTSIELRAVDAGEDAFVIWDDSEGKKVYLAVDDFVGTLPGTDPATGAENTNLLRNGAMNWFQRSTSESGLGSSLTGLADAWFHKMDGGVVYTASRSTDVPTLAQAGVTFNYSLKLDITTEDTSVGAGDRGFIRQVIEGFDFAVVAGRDCVLSFWVKSTLTGTYCIAFQNSGHNRVFVREYTINSAGAWEFKEVTMPASPSGGTWDYTTGAGLEIYWTLFCGSAHQTTKDAWNTVASTPVLIGTSSQVNFGGDTGNDFYMTGLQFQQGNAASEFQHVPISEDYIRMSRYYNKSFELGTKPIDNAGIGGALTATQTVGASTAQPHIVDVRFPSRMRISPTVSLYNPGGGSSGQVRNETIGAACSSSAANAVTDTGFYVTATTPGGSAVGNLLSVHYTADAEFTSA